MQRTAPFIRLYISALLLAVAAPSVCLARLNQQESAPAVNVPSLLDGTAYKYVEVRKGLWKIPEMPYEGENLRRLIIFLEPNPHNKSLRVSSRLGVLKNTAEAAALKEKLDDMNGRFKPAEFVFSDPVVFVVSDVAADKLDKDQLEKAIKEVAGVSDRAYAELTKYIELDLESRGAGVGMGAPGGADALSPSIFKSPPSPGGANSRNVDSKPVLLNRVAPQYTAEARDNKVEGAVVLRVLVDEAGGVKSVKVVRGLPYGLSEKAVEAAQKLRFKPAMKDGKAVAYWFAVEITYKLR